MTTHRQAFTLTLALAAWPGYATAQDLSDQDRFQLFNECRPMNIIVEQYAGDSDWTDIGLTVDRIRTMAESRLRAARLYDATALTHLYVNVNVLSRNFSVSLDHFKLLYDPVSDQTAYAPTWNRATLGTHSEDAGYILQVLSERFDQFILEYLRVNEDASNNTP